MYSRCMHICAYLCQWLVSDRATDGSICVFQNAQMQCVCILCLKQCSEVLGDLSGGVEVASLWQCDRAGLSLPVMDEHSQGEHLSFLSFLFPIIPRVLFSTKTCHVWPISFGCFWASVVWVMTSRFVFFPCFCYFILYFYTVSVNVSQYYQVTFILNKDVFIRTFKKKTKTYTHHVICFIISYTQLSILLYTIELILSIEFLYFSNSLADTALLKRGYMIMMLKRHTLIPQRAKVGLGIWGGVQSVRVIDLSWGDTHGRSQQHTCMILMGGQAAGHPHIWEMDPAVRPSDWADCGRLYSSVGSLDKRYDDQQLYFTLHS